MEMSEREENDRDARRDEDAFPDPPCPHLNADPEGRGWKCLDCGTHLTNERMSAIVRRSKLLNALPEGAR
jgi:hypothetical protein